MTKTAIICGKLFDGLSDSALGPTEILIEDGTIAEVSSSVGRPNGAKVLDLSDRTVSPGFIDTHVHLCVDGLIWRDKRFSAHPPRRLQDCITLSNTCATASQPSGTWARWIRNGPPLTCVTPSIQAWFGGRV